MLAGLTGEDDDESEPQPAGVEQIESERIKAAKNDSVSCDLGLRYPLLQSILLATRTIRPCNEVNIKPDISYDIESNIGYYSGYDIGYDITSVILS